MELVLYPDEKLRHKNARITPGALKIIKDGAKEMFGLMKQEGGVGLAAPQIGYNFKFFITKPGLLPHDIIINPVWQPSLDTHKYSVQEGCLSFPNLTLEVTRFYGIRVSYTTIRDKICTMDIHGFPAQVFQHEADHLNGTLFIDHFTKVI